VLIAYVAAPHRVGHRSGGGRHATAELVAKLPLPVPAVAGTRFALQREAARTANPTRWALVGAIVAMIVVTATLTFGSSLQTLVSQPRLYGWNWDYAVQSSGWIRTGAESGGSHTC
jgi:hypothetical protein